MLEPLSSTIQSVRQIAGTTNDCVSEIDFFKEICQNDDNIDDFSHGKENPPAASVIFWLCNYVFPCCGLPLVAFYKTKMWIFSKISVLKERLQIRTGRFFYKWSI